ncbi:SLC13 family permease [Corynebacterium sp. 35RC1]|nr:SLC13 family permease [Corynebacterium sp. 35RC1]
MTTATIPFPQAPSILPSFNLRTTLLTLVAVVLVAAILLAPLGLPAQASITLAVFAVAVWLWIVSPIPDTFVALGATCVLVIVGVISVEDMFAPLGDDTTWLLIGAFIVSAALSASGLAPRITAWLCADITSPRVLLHLITLALVVTAFMVPATSGRAALVLPIFLAIAAALPKKHQWYAVALSVIMPSVVLLSAVASFIGAGAHLITNQMLAEAGFSPFSFASWMLYGLPYALVASHISAEIMLLAMSTREQRSTPLELNQAEFAPHAPFSVKEIRCIAVLCTAVVLWCTESLHGLPPALVAIVAALVITSPQVGGVDLNKAIKKVPWSLLLFMAATVAIATALQTSGAAQALAEALFSQIPDSESGSGTSSQGRQVVLFVGMVVLLSTLAHLVIQSRSARSAVLIPLVIAVAPAMGVNPVAAAFISTAAAGFCHTLPSSAKPLAVFYSEDGEHPSFTPKQLLKVSLLIMPVHVLTLMGFALWIWPAMGLSIHL